MPTFLLIGIPRPRWLPPLPLPLFLLWPVALGGHAFHRALRGRDPDRAARARVAVEAFEQLRGLSIDIETGGQRALRIWCV